MATHLDLEEQEQLDSVKHFWKTYGNAITWVLVIVLGGFAAWNGWNWWQRNQAVGAASIFDELDRAAKAGQAERLPQIFGDLRDRYPRTVFAQQGGLIAAATLYEKGKADESRTVLAWVADNASEDEYRSIARLRLAGQLLDARQFDDALKQLDGVPTGPFAALAADRRGDVLAASDRKADAIVAYRKAWDTMSPDVEYRRLVEAKLVALGAPPTPAVADMPAAAPQAAPAAMPAASDAASTPAAASTAASTPAAASAATSGASR